MFILLTCSYFCMFFMLFIFILISHVSFGKTNTVLHSTEPRGELHMKLTFQKSMEDVMLVN